MLKQEITRENIDGNEITTNFNHKTNWYYEGNISQKVIEYLKGQYYDIEKDNSNNCSARGIDIIAVSPLGIKELIEVKGYPTENVTNGSNKGNKKKKQPKDTVPYWFSRGLFSCFKNYGAYHNNSNFLVALAFPNQEAYHKVISDVSPFFSDFKLSIKVYLVSEQGNVSITNLNSKS